MIQTYTLTGSTLALLLFVSPMVDAKKVGDLDLTVIDSDIEPAVTLKQYENRTVQEFRVNNNLYMIRITPAVGPPYYLVDKDGSGDMEWHRGGSALEQRVPQWTLFSW